MADEVEHLGHLAHGDRRRRLVHEHDLGFRKHGAGDGDGLALAARHRSTRSRGRVSDFNSLNSSPARLYIAGIVEDATAEPRHFAAEKDVGGGGQIVAERQVLMDDLDAVAAGIDRLVHDQVLAVHAQGAMGWQEVAGDHLDQRRLAGAVVAHQPDDFARLDRNETSLTA